MQAAGSMPSCWEGVHSDRLHPHKTLPQKPCLRSGLETRLGLRISHKLGCSIVLGAIHSLGRWHTGGLKRVAINISGQLGVQNGWNERLCQGVFDAPAHDTCIKHGWLEKLPPALLQTYSFLWDCWARAAWHKVGDQSMSNFWWKSPAWVRGCTGQGTTRVGTS